MFTVRTLVLILVGFSWIAVSCQMDVAATTIPPQATSTPESASVGTATTDITRPISTMAPVQTADAGPATLPLTRSIELSATLVPSAMPTVIPSETPIPANPVEAISLFPIVENAFSRPLYLAHANDDRLFVVEQAGLIRIIQNGKLLDQPFLDIQERVRSTELEQGLLGLAFHPDYAQTGTFFINYTDLSGDTHISRFLVSSDDPNFADPDSETLLLSISQPFANHNGGQMAFGPDGYLYVGVGDGGSANDPYDHGQNPGALLGSILRLDVNSPGDIYHIPATNPFVADEDRRNEIWAWGLRNPWRFSFDRETGDLFIADVGQNLWEEVNFQPVNGAGGDNYGWNILEGSHCFLNSDCDSEGTELPIFEYGHEEGCSITGGYVYRGTQFLELYGNYFVGDFCQGTVWRLFPESSGQWSARAIYHSDHVISSFGEDYNGELYLLDHTTGSLFQIRP